MKNNKGFSLVEPIVVIAIMAILAAVAVVSYSVYIERAQDAADEEYLSNVMYFSELYALEHQLELDKVVVDPVVESAQNIKLVIKNDAGESETIWVQEIYDAVGGNAFGKTYNNGVFDPDAEDLPMFPLPDDMQQPDDGTQDDGQAAVCDHELVETARTQSTCKSYGLITKACQKSGCDYTVTEKQPLADHEYALASSQDGFSYFVCNTCGKIIIKSDDGLPLVPIG